MTDTSKNIRATRIIGGVGTSKTQKLIDGVQAALAAGTAGKDILVVCATPQAALNFEKCLAAAGASGEGLTITNPRSLALDVLSDAEAVRWSGREPRMLTDYEKLFLLEDMKVTGLRPKRLREMLKFFYKSWTEMADDNEGWLLGGEETEVHAMVKGNLAFTRSVLEPEASNLAVNYLRTHTGAKAAHGFAHVFVDDYQRLSRASQLLCGLLATEAITIAGDRNGCVEVFDSYPYLAGLDEFMDAHTGAEDIELTNCQACAASYSAAKALMGADESMTTVAFEGASGETADSKGTAGEGAAGKGSTEAIEATGDVTESATIIENEKPADEYAAIADAVKEALAGGCEAQDVVIAVPNSVWSRNIAKALGEASIACAVLSDRQPVRGDIRDNAKCVPAHVLTALDLAADANNALAWRDWCGYNDWLANSSAIANLRAYGEEHNLGLVEALRALADGAQAIGEGTLEHVVGAQRVAMQYQAGLELLKKVEGLEGEELLDALTAAVSDGTETQTPAVVTKLCLSEGEDNSAIAMAKRFRENLLIPVTEAGNAVLIAPYDQTCGLSPKVLIVAGFVNGFVPVQAYFDSAEMPLDKQEKEHAKDTHRVYSLMGKAGERLVVSYFTKVPLEVAATLKLKIDRIRLESGTRMCRISESIFGEYVN